MRETRRAVNPWRAESRGLVEQHPQVFSPFRQASRRRISYFTALVEVTYEVLAVEAVGDAEDNFQ